MLALRIFWWDKTQLIIVPVLSERTDNSPLNWRTRSRIPARPTPPAWLDSQMRARCSSEIPRP